MDTVGGASYLGYLKGLYPAAAALGLGRENFPVLCLGASPLGASEFPKGKKVDMISAPSKGMYYRATAPISCMSSWAAADLLTSGAVREMGFVQQTPVTLQYS